MTKDEQMLAPHGEQGTDVRETSGQGMKKRGFFTKPLGIIMLVAVAFLLGNIFGHADLYILGSRSNYKPVSGLPEDLNYKSVEQLYDTLRSNYDGKLTESQVLDGLKKGLAESTGDPYTEYFTAKQASTFFDQINNSFSGIGAELGKDKDNNIIIVSPISGYPAAKAGLKAQDIITAIDGKSTAGLSIDEAVTKIRGEKDTEVKLRVVRGKAETLSFTIVRQTITIESVKTEMLDNNIGYIRINSFAEDTSELISKAAQDMKDKQAKGIILDLRGNPGGLLDAAVNVSSQWLPKDKKILDEKRDGKVVVETYKSAGPGTLAGIPTVILMDEGSASASEITAGALHDNGLAHIIGVKSYGKGVVQRTICVSGQQRSSNGGCSGDMLKVTVASWYRPNGQDINHKGIKPDQEVKLDEAAFGADGSDNQKQAAIDYLLKQ